MGTVVDGAPSGEEHDENMREQGDERTVRAVPRIGTIHNANQHHPMVDSLAHGARLDGMRV